MPTGERATIAVMSDDPAREHHSLRERWDAAHAAAEEVVAEESGQLGGEVSALAVPFEEIVAAVGAAIHPDRLAEGEVTPEHELAEGADPGAVTPAGEPAADPGPGSAAGHGDA